MKIKTYDFTRPFNFWLKRIVVNTAIDAYRSHNKHYHHLEIERVYSLPNEGVNPIQKMGYEELLLVAKKLSDKLQIICFRGLFSLRNNQYDEYFGGNFEIKFIKSTRNVP